MTQEAEATTQEAVTPDPRYTRSSIASDDTEMPSIEDIIASNPDEPGDADDTEPDILDTSVALDEGTEEVEPDVADEDQDKEEEAAESPPEGVLPDNEILRLAKEDPIELMAKLGVDGLAARFNRIAREKSGLRAREQMLEKKETELRGAEGVVRQAQSIAAELKQDPIAFVEKHVGRDAYEQWTRRIVGEESKSAPPQDDTRFAAMEKELATLRGKVQQSPYEQQAGEYLGQLQAAFSGDEFGILSSTYSFEQIQNETVELLRGMQERGEKRLTPTEALSTLKEAETARLKKQLEANPRLLDELGIKSTPPSDSKVTQPPAVKTGAHRTLTEQLQAPSASGSDFDEDDLSDAERIRRIVARHG